jgi:transposase-like protein
MKNQDRITRQTEMLSLIEQWHESGKSQQLFCQEHNLTYTTFYYWLKRYRRGIDENSFLPVEVSSGSHIEIRYPGGVVLQLPAETRLSTLKQLLSL